MKHLGVSRSGYHAWLKRVPSNTEKRREAVKAKIKDIYDESKQNYGPLKLLGNCVNLEKSSSNVPLVSI